MRKWITTITLMALATAAIAADPYLPSLRCGPHGCANYVRVAQNGIGDLLIFPIFYADLHSFSRIAVVNNSNKLGVVAQLTVKSSGCSEILASTLLYLTPKDSWTGYIREDSGKVQLFSEDDSSIYGKTVASETSPLKIPLVTPKNPTDIPNIGYVEVKTLAYVNTKFVDPDNSSLSYSVIMRTNRFTEEHLFMQWLYEEKGNRYNSIAYFNNTDNFTGIIFPADEHTDFHKINPIMTSEGRIDPEFEDGVLSGTMEITLVEYGAASYQAVAIKDYSMLGDDILTKSSGFRYNWDFNANYKPDTNTTNYLDRVGYIDLLDTALAKSKVTFHYYADRINSSAFAFLVFPTKQLSYDPTTKRCIATEHTSGVWQEGLRLEQQQIDIATTSDKGEKRKCAFSPCIWSNTAMLGIVSNPNGFDPFIYKSGTVAIDLASTDPGYMELYSPVGPIKIKWTQTNALPCISIVCSLKSEAGISLSFPQYMPPYISPGVLAPTPFPLPIVR